jgi:hypothetical protein
MRKNFFFFTMTQGQREGLDPEPVEKDIRIITCSKLYRDCEPPCKTQGYDSLL